MSLTKTKTSKKASKRTGNSPEAQFEREWARVQRLQKANAKLQSDLERLEKRVMAEIREEEQALTQEIQLTTQHLLGFVTRKSLTQWQRQTLMDWIVEQVRLLQTHPFADPQGVVALIDEVSKTFQELLGTPDDIAEVDEAPDSEEEETETNDEPQQEGFWDDDIPDDIDEYEEDAADEEFFERLYEEFEAREEQEAQREREESFALDQLLKSSSISKLFRKIAHIIHPDREQDPEQQKTKHELMGQLIEARDKHDIPTIFAMYSEHVGQSPLPMIDGDIAKITQLLKAQVKRLKREKAAILEAGGLQGAIYEKFHAKTARGTDQKIQIHLEMVRENIHSERSIRGCITSLKSLKPFLEERYEEQFFFGRF